MCTKFHAFIAKCTILPLRRSTIVLCFHVNQGVEHFEHVSKAEHASSMGVGGGRGGGGGGFLFRFSS